MKDGEKEIFAARRQAMVEKQLRRRGIRDPIVLAAFLKVPREKFVPESEIEIAYADHPVPIGLGQTVSQPYMVALMAQELELKGGEKLLEIGTGSGYQTALLAEMGCSVYSVERIESLATSARARLQAMGYEGIRSRVGDGTLGWLEEAPYDRITVGAGGPRVPSALIEQLADGGILVIPVGSEHFQELLVVAREGDRVRECRGCGCSFVRLIGRQGW